ncbi:MAG TPA: MbnP family protein [Bacteroidia bacterium]
MLFMFVAPFQSSAQRSSQRMLSIAFDHYVDSLLLSLDSTVYKNALGQTYVLTNFKYYISNITLHKAEGKEYKSNDYFLVQEDENKTKHIDLNNIPKGEYTSISFTIGVDSLHNCSGAQSGALDPVNTMFWAWNTGYIFLKLEGKAVASASPGHIFEYHIGGYKAPNNCIRNITLPFSKPLQMEEHKSTDLHVKVNVAELFRTPLDVDFTSLSTVTDFHNATRIADNYQDMFSIIASGNEK